MNLSRRSFLGGVLSVEPVDAPDAPTVVGDGIHDDADGIEALVSGRPVRIDDEILVAKGGDLGSCAFFVSRPINLLFSGEWEFDDLHLITNEDGVRQLPLVNISRWRDHPMKVTGNRIVMHMPGGTKFDRLVSRYKKH